MFLAPDSIVPQPGNPAALNRYAYADNNPLKHNDPNGHQANIPSVNGSLGCTGLLGANTVTVANPATQPLTTATYFTQNDVVIRPSSARPDDGVFLMYHNPGYLRPRTETVVYAVTGPPNPFVGGSVEHRRVTTYEGLFDWSEHAAYDETAISGGLGPGGAIGAEWGSAKGQVAPAVGLNAGGVKVQLQPGQLMAGVTNPMGVGGARAGAEYQLSSNSLFVTSQGYFSGIGGVREFSKLHARNATLIREVYVPGQWTKWGWMSGHDRLRWQLWGMGLEAEEVP